MSYISPDKALAPQFQYTSDNYVSSTKTFADQNIIKFNERTLYNSGTAFISAVPPNVSTPRLTISVQSDIDRYIWMGEVMIMSQYRTNSPANAQFRHFSQRYRFRVYNDGDCDADGYNSLILADDMQGSGNRAGYGVFSYCSNSSPPSGYSWNSGHFHMYWDFTSWQGHPLWIKIKTSNAADRDWRCWWS